MISCDFKDVLLIYINTHRQQIPQYILCSIFYTSVCIGGGERDAGYLGQTVECAVCVCTDVKWIAKIQDFFHLKCHKQSFFFSP